MPKRTPKTSTRRRALIAASVGATFVVATAAGVAVVRSRDDSRASHAHGASTIATAGAAVRVARRETRPTLDPAGFSGQAALAYQVAREIPAVLDQMRCYCACDSGYGHVSLLSCYVDGHGST